MDDFIRCLADKLENADVEIALRECAESLDNEVFFSITGKQSTEELDEAAMLALLEAFLGGVDLRLLSIGVAKKIYGYIVAKAQKFKGRRGEAAKLAAYLAGEAVDRLAAGIKRPKPPLPAFPVTPAGLAVIHGFLWPFHVEVEEGVELENTIERILDEAAQGGAGIRGCPGCGRSALLYLVAREAADRGMRILYGMPQEWMGDRVLVVSPSPAPGSAVPTIWVEEGGGRIFSDSYLAELTVRILEFDGVEYSEEGVERLVGKSKGSPIYIEGASLLLRLRGLRAEPSVVDSLPSDTRSLVAEAAGSANLHGFPRLPVFPGDLAAGAEELAEQHVLLTYNNGELYAYRNSLWLGHAGRVPGAEEALASRSPWWAALLLSTHLGLQEELVERAAGILLGSGLLALDAVAAVSPAALYEAFYPYTSFRVEVIAGKAVESNAYSAAAVLYGLAADLLKGLTDDRYAERRAFLLIKRAEAEVERGLPEAALPLLREAQRIASSEWAAAAALIDEGVALALLGDKSAAEKLEEGLRLLEGRPDAMAAKAYATLGALAETSGEEADAIKWYKHAVDVLAELVYRGDCSFASELYRVGVKLRELRGRGDPRICGGLAKCGRFELYTKYGC